MMQPLGPEAIRSRIEEIRAKLQAVNPPVSESFSPALSGAIGSASTDGQQQATAPLNPLSGQIIGAPGKTAYRPMIEAAARQAGIDPDILDSIVEVESDYNPMCRSRAGAMGLTQLMPSNCAEYGVRNPFDPKQNLEAGAKHFADMVRRHPGSIELALASYNAGPGAVAKYGGIPPYRETQNYVRKVLAAYEARKGR